MGIAYFHCNTGLINESPITFECIHRYLWLLTILYFHIRYPSIFIHNQYSKRYPRIMSNSVDEHTTSFPVLKYFKIIHLIFRSDTILRMWPSHWSLWHLSQTGLHILQMSIPVDLTVMCRKSGPLIRTFNTAS